MFSGVLEISYYLLGELTGGIDCAGTALRAAASNRNTLLALLSIVVLVGSVVAVSPPSNGASSASSEQSSLTVMSVAVDSGQVSMPGVDESGVYDPAALATVHTEILGETSYTATLNRTIVGSNGTLRPRTVRVTIDAVRGRYHYVQTETVTAAFPV